MNVSCFGQGHKYKCEMTQIVNVVLHICHNGFSRTEHNFFTSPQHTRFIYLHMIFFTWFIYLHMAFGTIRWSSFTYLDDVMYLLELTCSWASHVEMHFHMIFICDHILLLSKLINVPKHYHLLYYYYIAGVFCNVLSNVLCSATNLNTENRMLVLVSIICVPMYQK